MPRQGRWLASLVFLAVLSALASWASSDRAIPTATLDGVVVRVVDGDTIRVRIGSREEKVRYIGVNTPEVRQPRRGEEPGGTAARRINRQLVEGRRVRLELDVQRRDRYGRLLAYVWLGDVMVNAELVRRGYAEAMTVPPNVRYAALFRELQREARDAGRGLWSPS